MIPPHLLQQLRTTSVQELVRALERDGFSYRRTRGGSRVYRHPDGRRAVVHYHRGSDTLPIDTLRSVLAGARWTEDDLRRLNLIT
jgi:predicted RNA binding protein YcfA (HicA-like mRNA interferase family)